MNEFDLVNRLRGTPRARAVEVGEVVSEKPLVVRIGNGEYKAGAGGWRFYEAVYELEKMEFETVALTGVSAGLGSLNATKGTAKKGKARMKYKKGDLLAVQQMAGDASFIILAKLEEVV